MPRNVSGVFSLPPGTTAVPNALIRSADYNTVLADIAATLNAPTPVTAGGTGGTSGPTALTGLGVSTFAQTILDDADAAAVRVTIGIIEKVLRYDATQTLTGADLTQAQSNLKAILAGGVLGGWYEPAGFRITGATGTSWMWELQTDANEWRLTMRGPRAASGTATLIIRCGSASAAADSGASDYYNQNYTLANTTFASGAAAGNAPSSFQFLTGTAQRRVVAEGSLGSAADVWTLAAAVNTSYASTAASGHQFSYRQSPGRKPRIFLTSDVALVAGDFILEARN